MKEINVRNVIRIQMYKHKKWTMGIPGFPCMPLFSQKVKAGLLLWGLCLWLSACHTDTKYHVYQSVPGEGSWQKTDSLVFNLPPDVPAGTCRMEVGIRHTGTYPYRDIWLSVTQIDGDSLPPHTDTLHIYLADEKGQWSHEGAIGGLYQAAYVYDKPVVLKADSIGRQFRVTHLMRQNPLPGVSDVGIRLFFPGGVNAEEHK